MKKLISFFVVLGTAIGLSACGGGGDSSTGGSNGNNPYAGSYIGTIQTTATGFGVTETANHPAVVSITENGQVLADLLSDTGPAPNCSGVGLVYMNGNTFNDTDTYTCKDATLGTCKITETNSGSVNGNVLSGRGNATLHCTVGGIYVRYTYKGTKQ